MHWVEKVSKDNIFESESKNEEINFNDFLNFKKSTIKTEKKRFAKITTISQFFLSGSISTKYEVVNRIFPPSKVLFEQAVEEVARHFKIIELFESNKTAELRFYKPNESSLKLLNKVEKNSIVADLFWREGNHHDIVTSNKHVYLVKSSNIEPYENEEFDLVWNFYLSVQPGKKDFLIDPKNWKFTDGLLDSYALRYFTSKCTNVYLWVDNDSNNVQHIHLKLL